jgi:hypothetical protein
MLRDRGFVMAIVARILSGQHYRAIASDLGMSAARLATLLYRIELPCAWVRTRLAGDDTEATAEATLERLGYELAGCAATGKLFFREVQHRATVRFCRAVRVARQLPRELEDFAPTAPSEPEETPG